MDQNKVNEDAEQIKQYKNFLFFQKSEKLRKQKLKEIKIKKFEGILESLELLFQKDHKDPNIFNPE